MTTAEVAEHLGGITPHGAHKWLKARGIEPSGRQPGNTGQNLYPRALVMAAERSYRGRRFDLHGPPSEPAGEADS
ncbi:MAG: hypothetical protein ACREX8_00720 [Gammaproteobacteria bacterium]